MREVEFRILRRLWRGEPWPGPSGLHGVPQVPLCLQRQPDLRIPACQRLEQERGVGADRAARALTMAFSRWKGMFMRVAASTWDTPSGSRRTYPVISQLKCNAATEGSSMVYRQPSPLL